MRSSAVTRDGSAAAGIWPAETPLAADVDLGFLARQFKLSGGNIKNIALAAMPVGMQNQIDGIVERHHESRHVGIGDGQRPAGFDLR